MDSIKEYTRKCMNIRAYYYVWIRASPLISNWEIILFCYKCRTYRETFIDRLIKYEEETPGFLHESPLIPGGFIRMLNN